MYQRTTTASRRFDQMMRDKWLHVSQWFRQVKVVGDDGITRYESVPQMTRMEGKKSIAHGNTYTVGRNKFKRACVTLGISRVLTERNLRAGQSVYDAMAGA